MSPFDTVIDRRGSDSFKWGKYAGRDILPLWVADMDFAAPPAVLDALHRRIEHGVFGYGGSWPSLTESVLAHLEDEYGWAIEPEWLVWLPGLVSGLNVACRAVDGEVLTATPIYPPFLSAPQFSGRPLKRVDLALGLHVVRDHADAGLAREREQRVGDAGLGAALAQQAVEYFAP